jgi:hypothetical protein
MRTALAVASIGMAVAIALFGNANAADTAAASPTGVREVVLDDFETIDGWKLATSDDVKASLRAVDGIDGKAMCIDFDFGKVTGYVSASRHLPIDYPARYELNLGVRGDALRNALQVKLVDASGENVWWSQKREYRFPADWQTLKLRQRQIEFAWGPTTDRGLRHTETVELVIASGSGAGKGSACFDRLTFRELPPEPPAMPIPKIMRDGSGTLTIDYGQPREFDGLALRWPDAATTATATASPTSPNHSASTYDIQSSDDGQHWRPMRHVERARGSLQSHWLPDSEARFLRVVIDTSHDTARDPSSAPAEVELLDAPTANAFFMKLASTAPPGTYPRAYAGQQSYWTVFGIDGGRIASLLSEDGVVEPVPGVGAIEPMLIVDKKVLTWADARITHSLRDGDLPMPEVHWKLGVSDGDISLDIAAHAQGTPQSEQAVARYTVRNTSKRARDVSLALAWRPFQANPPTQFLTHPGGASEIGSISWDGRALMVDGVIRAQPLLLPSGVRIEPLAAGPVTAWLDQKDVAAGGPTASTRLTDSAGFASAVLRYDFHLRPGERREVVVALPVEGAPTALTAASVASGERSAITHWRERLDRVRISGPAEVDDVARTLRTALGHILVNRSGPALQPGARAYARSWIRDGALTSSALLRLGHEDVARDFLKWFAPFQFKNGKVPCCATVLGADPVPENDSDGEFIFAAADLWHYTHDDATLRSLWPNVRAAFDHMETLRISERTDANRQPERRAYFGLMPPSISHEGYSDKAAYSYWDDFWAATGYRSAVEVAQALGLSQDAERMSAQRDEFVADLRASIDASTRFHRLDVLPGAADRGDFDPTSSTVALSPGGLLGTLPDTLVRNTFDRYWSNFTERRDSGKVWDAYTPYEWRTVGSFIRLGQRERASQAMAFFYRDRRPAGWNQWAEVVSRQAREPRFLGDMPHGWVASDHIRSVLDLFAFDDEAKHVLVLAAGVPLEWLEGPGLALQNLRTPYGSLSWSARSKIEANREGKRKTVTFELQKLRDQPPGGITLRGPWPKDARAWIDGRAVDSGTADEIRLSRTPARVRIELPVTP